MASKYLIQIIDKQTGLAVQWEPGRAVEKDFIEDILKRLPGKGIGIVRTTDHVVADVRAAIEEALFELKVRVK